MDNGSLGGAFNLDCAPDFNQDSIKLDTNVYFQMQSDYKLGNNGKETKPEEKT